jgi:hypothetical protein
MLLDTLIQNIIKHPLRYGFFAIETSPNTKYIQKPW